jgi:hypothetical protein
LQNSTTESFSLTDGSPDSHYTSIYLPGVSNTSNTYEYYNSGASERLASTNIWEETTQRSTSIYYDYNGDTDIIVSGSKSISTSSGETYFSEQYAWTSENNWILKYTNTCHRDGPRALSNEYVFGAAHDLSTMFSYSYGLTGTVWAAQINYTYPANDNSSSWTSITGILYSDESETIITATYSITWDAIEMTGTLTIRDSAGAIIAADTYSGFPNEFIWIN